MKRNHSIYLLFLFSLWNCDGGQSVHSCQFSPVAFSTNFPAARVSMCAQVNDNSYRLTIAPENVPINPSPWYAFRVDQERSQVVEVHMRYQLHRHRYRPKISIDGEQWQLLDPSMYQVLDDGQRVLFSFNISQPFFYIAAQEILDNDDYQEWISTWRAHADHAVIGTSVQGRPIERLLVRGESNKWILLTGRQHPPEVTGAFALHAFANALFADSDIAQRFRQRYNVLIVPNMNPDGVVAGHWRHNANGVDLNRDWGLFTQPETSVVHEELTRLLGDDQQLVLGLDFHSTHRDVFYTQPDGTTRLPNFTQQWLAAIQHSVPQFTVNRQPSHNQGRPTFKQHISTTYNIPAITYEMGDQTDRNLISQVGIAAATEMMRILLALP